MKGSVQRGFWYNVFDKMEIVPASSGGYRIFLRTNILSYGDYKELLEQFMILMRAPSCVESPNRSRILKEGASDEK